jgi:hypothetical protein
VVNVAFEESTESTIVPQVTGKIAPRTVNIFLLLGIIGSLGMVVHYFIWVGIYLEYIRLYAIDPMNWTVLEPVVDTLIAIDSYFFYPAMLTAIGFYGVLDRNGGKYGLIFVFIMLWPHTFDLYEFLYFMDYMGFNITYEIYLLVNLTLNVGVAVVLGLILLLIRKHVGKPTILYLAVIMTIAYPIVIYVRWLLDPGDIAANATEYFIRYSPYIASLFLMVLFTTLLFVVEYRRNRW